MKILIVDDLEDRIRRIASLVRSISENIEIEDVRNSTKRKGSSQARKI